MSSGSLEGAEEITEVLFEPEQSIVSSADPPIEQWSSLMCMLAAPEINIKRQLYEEGLYTPPSEEICAKYIALSDSSVFRHPYYAYPAVIDPGIEEALFKTPREKEYPDDGQELYLDLCKEMKECPCKLFYRQLLEPRMDLSYYSVSTLGVRPMAIALKRNQIVTSINFKDNFLSNDACFHLGNMLSENTTISELILTGCKIGTEGVKRLVANLHKNVTLIKLALNKNAIGDAGVHYLGEAIAQGCRVAQLNLSQNNLTASSASKLAESIVYQNRLTHLDLSWNSLLVPKPVEILCNQLRESDFLTEVDFSWNSLTARFTNALQHIFLAPNIRNIYLSNNKLCDAPISMIAQSLGAARNLAVLDLSYNPLTLTDAMMMVTYMKRKKVKLQKLLMDGVYVNENIVKNINLCKKRKKAVITHGYVVPTFVPVDRDRRDLVLTRAQKVCNKPKKKRVDVGLLILKLQKLVKNEPISIKELPRYFKLLGAFQMNDDLVEAIGLAFPGPAKGKFKTANVKNMAEYVRRKWPDAQLPPTPPPEPEPTPPPKGKPGDKKKDQGKKRK